MMACPRLCCLVLAGALLVGGASADWANRLTDSLADDADKATIEQLIAEGGGISAKSCGGLGDALEVVHVGVESNALAVVVRGTLVRPLSGGRVHAKLKLRKPSNMSMGQHFKYTAASAFTRARKFSEPLCRHLGLTTAGKGAATSDDRCSIAAGQQEFRLSFRQLPQVVFAGTYELEIHVSDEESLPVACVQGGLTVKPGKSKGVLRKLESGCLDIIDEYRWAISEFHVHDGCGEGENRKDLNFHMHDGNDFWLQGHWFEVCKDPANTELHVWKRHKGLFKDCDPADASSCSDLGCSGVVCREDPPGTGYQCEPSEGDNKDAALPRCEEDGRTYHINPDEVHDKCSGEAIAASFASRCPASVATLAAILVSSARLLLRA